MSKYTAEQVRDWHRTQASYYVTSDRGAATKHYGFADAIDALLRERESAKAAELPIDHPSMKIGSWLSAALDDPGVCAEMKADITAWFNAGKPMLASARVPDEVPACSCCGRTDTLETKCVDCGEVQTVATFAPAGCQDDMLAAAPKPEAENEDKA